MFDKILIANRGEIACRVIRTAKRLGIKTVAVYSDADYASMHTSMADEAYHVGPPPAVESYLNSDLIIDAALKSGAGAIHPGYGFLSENADFADKCSNAGLVFIGPPAEAIRSMGSKSAAKNIMEKAGVPVVPGYYGDDQSDQQLSKAAKKTGFPLLIKAAAGGGGKGMRIVRESDEFNEALSAVRREALAYFADDRILIEKYLTGTRHIEIQIFADTHGNLLHLFERDCSIQRRHQKIIEEAPAPGIDSKLRDKMGKAAIAAAKAIDYVGAGTVEFLLDNKGAFYFMEMNTRLQVEHAVTEMITGIDMVEWQILVASGEAIPCSQEDISITGHAIEVRVYAEDPSRNFLPSTGKMYHLRTPRENSNIRLDTGVRENDELSIHYDPMISKLIVRDNDRYSALRCLHRSLADFQIAGVITNLDFLRSVTSHQAFINADIDTGFIENHNDDLFTEIKSSPDQVLILATLQILLNISQKAHYDAASSTDPHSPWHLTNGWQINDNSFQKVTYEDGDSEVTVKFHYMQGGYLFNLPSGQVLVKGEQDADNCLLADLGGTRIKATVVQIGQEITVINNGTSHRLLIIDKYKHGEVHGVDNGSLTAPMPGKIISIMVREGDTLEPGAPIMILEAMKMEHTIKAPGNGKITGLKYSVGDQVNEGDELISFEPDGPPDPAA